MSHKLINGLPAGSEFMLAHSVLAIEHLDSISVWCLINITAWCLINKPRVRENAMTLLRATGSSVFQQPALSYVRHYVLLRYSSLAAAS